MSINIEEGTQSIKCPFCHGKGEVLVDDEKSRTWAFEVRERALSEMKKADISQELFACAALGCRQSYFNKLLSSVAKKDFKLEGRRASDLRQLEAFLRLPHRTRQDIYERVASDPEAFALATKFHTRLLLEDAGVPGISQVARAVLERFAAEVTLYPNPTQVAILAQTLQLAPSLVCSFLDERALKMTSFRAPEFKVPDRPPMPPLQLKTSASGQSKKPRISSRISTQPTNPPTLPINRTPRRPHTGRSVPTSFSVRVPVPSSLSLERTVLSPVNKTAPEFEAGGAPTDASISAIFNSLDHLSDNSSPPLLASRPSGSLLIASSKPEQPNPIILTSGSLVNSEHPNRGIVASESLLNTATVEVFPQPERPPRHDASTPQHSLTWPWPASPPVASPIRPRECPEVAQESEDSFVQALLTHPPPELPSMQQVGTPQTPQQLDMFPNSPLRTPVRGMGGAQSVDDVTDY